MSQCNRLIGYLCVSLLSCLATGSPAHAVIVFQDNFQTDTAVLSNSSDDADPVIDSGAGDIGMWDIRENPGLSVQVENDVTPDNPASGSGTENFLRVYKGG